MSNKNTRSAADNEFLTLDRMAKIRSTVEKYDKHNTPFMQDDFDMDLMAEGRA